MRQHDQWSRYHGKSGMPMNLSREVLQKTIWFKLQYLQDRGAMVQHFRLVILFVMLLCLQIVNAQVSNNWRKRYGPTAAESYILHDGIAMTAYYSGEGKTCKIEIERPFALE